MKHKNKNHDSTARTEKYSAEKLLEEYKNFLENVDPSDLDRFFADIMKPEYIIEDGQCIGAKLYEDLFPFFIFFFDTVQKTAGFINGDEEIKTNIDGETCWVFNQYISALYRFEQEKKNIHRRK